MCGLLESRRHWDVPGRYLCGMTSTQLTPEAKAACIVRPTRPVGERVKAAAKAMGGVKVNVKPADLKNIVVSGK